MTGVVILFAALFFGLLIVGWIVSKAVEDGSCEWLLAEVDDESGGADPFADHRPGCGCPWHVS